MSTRWFILYRGPLASCNYGCNYCPFAKKRDTRAELQKDAECLQRFVDWVGGRKEEIGVLFTPWGEALVQRHYQRAMAELSHMPHVWKVAAQTNLSCKLEWLSAASRETTGLWCTYHPSETTLPRFLQQLAVLDGMGIRYSVGVVGHRSAIEQVEELRAALRPEVYLWVNAWKREANYYSEDELSRIIRVDPLFHFNLHAHPSLGRACRAGSEAFTVDGEGDMRRCHFISSVIGNIYQAGFESALRPTPCTNAECRCHIGYVHMPELGLHDVFGSGILERIPQAWAQ